MVCGGDTSSGVGAYGTPPSTPRRLRAKLCDFGSAACLPQPALLGEGERFGCGTTGWAAPELLSAVEGDKVEVGTSADIFSFAIILWRCLKMDVGTAAAAAAAAAVDFGTENNNPLQGLVGAEAVKKIVEGNVRPQWPDHSPDPTVADMGKLLDDLWASEPTARPTAADAVARLVQFTSGYTRWSRPKDDSHKHDDKNYVSHSKLQRMGTPVYLRPKSRESSSPTTMARRQVNQMQPRKSFVDRFVAADMQNNEAQRLTRGGTPPAKS